tara:strand:- start:442 stop:708 length:267 start_codon:yes stop_codon:yes gene_type:complete
MVDENLYTLSSTYQVFVANLDKLRGLSHYQYKVAVDIEASDQFLEHLAGSCEEETQTLCNYLKEARAYLDALIDRAEVQLAIKKKKNE